MESGHEDYRERVQAIFRKARFIQCLGIEVVDFGPGWCETGLTVGDLHMQQDGFVHAGVVAAMADHTAGAATGTQAQAGEVVLTVEFKINLLRPAVGERLRCRAEVLRAGRQLTVAESEVFACRGSEEKLVAKALVTLALVKAGNGRD